MVAVKRALHWSALLVVVAAVAGTADAKTGLDSASRAAMKEQVCTNSLARFQSDMRNIFSGYGGLATRHEQLTGLQRAAGEVGRGHARGCDWA